MKYPAGVKIKRARIQKGMTQKELAQAAGVKPPYICDIEKGNRRGSYEVLTKIADALGLDTNEIWEVA